MKFASRRLFATVPQEGFEPDNDTVALYHFDEQVGRGIRDFSKSRVNGNLMGKAKLVPSKAPTDLSVKVHGKVTVTWGKVKKCILLSLEKSMSMAIS